MQQQQKTKRQSAKVALTLLGGSIAESYQQSQTDQASTTLLTGTFPSSSSDDLFGLDTPSFLNISLTSTKVLSEPDESTEIGLAGGLTAFVGAAPTTDFDR